MRPARKRSWKKWLMRRIRYPLGYRILHVGRILRVIRGNPLVEPSACLAHEACDVTAAWFDDCLTGDPGPGRVSHPGRLPAGIPGPGTRWHPRAGYPLASWAYRDRGPQASRGGR